jgi:hypothetical protein
MGPNKHAFSGLWHCPLAGRQLGIGRSAELTRVTAQPFLRARTRLRYFSKQGLPGYRYRPTIDAGGGDRWDPKKHASSVSA